MLTAPVMAAVAAPTMQHSMSVMIIKGGPYNLCSGLGYKRSRVQTAVAAPEVINLIVTVYCCCIKNM